MDTGNHGQGVDRFGYTWGQRLLGLGLRGLGVVGGSFLGGPLGAKVGGAVGSRLSNAWNNAHSGYYAGTNHFDLNQIGMPQQQDFSSGYNPALNPGFTNFNQPGLQTIAQQPFKTVDPTLYGPLLDVHVDGDGRGGGDGGGNSAASGASVGLTYNKLMGGGARAGWGTTRGPNYS